MYNLFFLADLAGMIIATIVDIMPMLSQGVIAMPSKRKIISMIIALIIISLGSAFYAEFNLHIEPCPLCIAERVILFAILIPTTIFFIHNPKSKIFKWIYSIMIIIIAGFGIKVSAHHVWLTNLPPDQQPLSCGMPLDVMYQNLPLHSFLHKVLMGDAECAKVNWHILGINAPTVVVALFTFILLLTLIILATKHDQH